MTRTNLFNDATKYVALSVTSLCMVKEIFDRDKQFLKFYQQLFVLDIPNMSSQNMYKFEDQTH